VLLTIRRRYHISKAVDKDPDKANALLDFH
jgi:hypothetical protein